MIASYRQTKWNALLCQLRYLLGDCNCLWMQISPTMNLPNQITLSFKTDNSHHTLPPPCGSSTKRDWQFCNYFASKLFYQKKRNSQTGTLASSLKSLLFTKTMRHLQLHVLAMSYKCTFCELVMNDWHLTFTVNTCLCNSSPMERRELGLHARREGEENTNMGNNGISAVY